MIALFIFLGGCAQLPIRSGLFSITGDLANYANESCSLLLSENSQSFGRVIGSGSVLGVFEEQFVVTSTSREYRIMVTCNSRVIHQRLVIYPGSIGYGGVVALRVLI